METIIPTCYGRYASTVRYLGQPFVPLEGSTLNEKFNVGDVDPLSNIGPDEYPKPTCMVIGNGGEGFDQNSSGGYFMFTVPHIARHAALYRHIPFIIGPANGNDIAPALRPNYRLRTIVTDKDNNQRVAYYGKALEPTTATTTELRTVVNSRIISAEAFNTAESDLEPQPIELNNYDITNPDGKYIAVTSKSDFQLSLQEVSDLKAACYAIFGDERYAYITEMGYVSGIDRDINLEHDDITGEIGLYTESLFSQIQCFISARPDMNAIALGSKITIELGSVDPMLVS